MPPTKLVVGKDGRLSPETVRKMAIDFLGGGFLVGKGNFYPLAFPIPFETALNELKEMII